VIDPHFSSLPDPNPKIKKFLDLDGQKGFDCALLLDVLEHVEDDKDFLKRIYSLLNDNARVILTVPAWDFLFSGHDRFLGHHRRYNRKTLSVILDKFEIENSFYFYGSLLLMRLAIKLLEFFGLEKKQQEGVSNWKFGENHFLTIVIRKVLNFDFSVSLFFSRLNLKIPGLSLCMILKKR
jgi:hypothetical protein